MSNNWKKVATNIKRMQKKCVVKNLQEIQFNLEIIQ